MSDCPYCRDTEKQVKAGRNTSGSQHYKCKPCQRHYTPGIHTRMPDESETFHVEGVNAELRHYLARLVRRSRCFSRCQRALQRTIKLFVYAWNRRQQHR